MVYPEKAKLDIWLDIWFPFKLMFSKYVLHFSFGAWLQFSHRPPHHKHTAGKDKEGHLLAEVTLSCAVLSSSALAKRSEWKLLSCVQLFATPWTNLTSKTKTWKLTKLILFERQFAAAAAKSLQPCPTLCDPIDGSPPGSPIPGILQARTLEWVAISFSSAWKWKVKGKSLSRVWVLATPWTAAYQAPPSMGFSRQEYWSGVPLPSPAKAVQKHFIAIQAYSWVFSPSNS